MDRNKIHVYSEIGKLKKVILHRPGEEIENLTPELLERLLFDDIPFLKIAREEHDAFAKVLENDGVEVLYLEKLAAEAVENKHIKEKFLDELISESEIENNNLKGMIKNYLNSFDNKAMVDKIMAGIRKKEIGMKEDFNDYPFIMDPMPNLYFTRDPFALIGKGVSINSMRTKTRKRETIFGKYIFKYHPEFKENEVPLYYNRYENYNIEGGDELILSDKVLAIGNSQRTDKEAVEVLAKNIFESRETFETILMFNIPKIRAFMHLDTVFTMIDHDKFTVHPGIEGELKVIAMTYNKKDNSINMIEEEGTVDAILSKYLNKDISVIRCGGGDKIISGREQWNDGSNTLAIAPGKVITYERNYVTNEILDKNNIKVITIASSELSRGRGGPRCMSMPLYREDLD